MNGLISFLGVSLYVKIIFYIINEVSNIFVLFLQYTCMDTQFKCKGNDTVSDFCITQLKHCDGNPDCPNKEDEENCPPKTCQSNQV